MSNQKPYQLIHADVIDGLRQLKDSDDEDGATNDEAPLFL